MTVQIVQGLLSSPLVKDLCRRSNFLGFWQLFVNWALIVISMGWVAWNPSWVSIVVALLVIANRQLALAIQMHDCAHFAVFKTKKLNNFIGKWFCAAPVFADLSGYRRYHMQHHRKVGTHLDPDRSNYIRYPVSLQSMARKCFRDLFFITGIKTLYIIWLMNSGQIAYQLSYEKVLLPQQRSLFKVLQQGIRNLFPSILFLVLAGTLLLFLGHIELLGLWFFAYLSPYMLFSRIRNASEHGHTADVHSKNPLDNSRTTYAGWIARLTVAPNYVNYHLDHHLMPSMPAYNLPRFHHFLLEKGVYSSCDLQNNYRQLIKRRLLK